jgi:2-methylcitrate dehydratase
MRHAIALAAMRSATPRLVRRGHITAAKFLANPLVAQSGVMGAILAKGGMTGPQAVLEDEDGIRTLFTDKADFAVLDAPMSEPPFAINLSHVKAFPCLATGQAETAAAIEMHKWLKGRIDQIESYDVVMADYHQVREQQEDQARRYPDSREAADHSFYFLAAIGMMDGALTMHTYDNARWTQPDVTSLMAKARMVIDPAWNKRAPLGYPCAIEVKLKDGSTHRTEVAYAPGHSKGTLEEAAVFEKFDRLTKGVIDSKRQTQVKELVMKLETATSIAPLMELVGAVKA